MKNVIQILSTTFFLFLIACSGGEFEGDYEAAGGMQEFNFKSDGTMVQYLMGKKAAEFKFEKDGNEIKTYMNDSATQIFTLKENGDLIGPSGIVLTPKN